MTGTYIVVRTSLFLAADYVQELGKIENLTVRLTPYIQLSLDPSAKTAMSSPTLYVNANEAELIRLACEGDREAFYRLVQPYERSVYNMAMSMLKNQADAEEVAQEAILKALGALPRFRGEAKFSTWLIQITVNEARLKLRKDRRHLYESVDAPQTDEEGDCFPKDFADWREIPSEELQRKQLREALKRALESLPPKYREVLILRDVQHLNIQETARVLGISEGCVKTRLLRARFHMRDALAPGIDGSWMSGRFEYQKVRPW